MYMYANYLLNLFEIASAIGIVIGGPLLCLEHGLECKPIFFLAAVATTLLLRQD